RIRGREKRAPHRPHTSKRPMVNDNDVANAALAGL
ncbi:hypothetical protein CCACVL1_08361, partial [Corchorus capsularis]